MSRLPVPVGNGLFVTIGTEHDVTALEHLAAIKLAIASTPEKRLAIVRDGLARMIETNDEDGLDGVRHALLPRESIVEIAEMLLPRLSLEAAEDVAERCAYILAGDELAAADTAEKTPNPQPETAA